MNLFERILRGDLDELLEEDVFFNYTDYSSLNEDSEWEAWLNCSNLDLYETSFFTPSLNLSPIERGDKYQQDKNYS